MSQRTYQGNIRVDHLGVTQAPGPTPRPQPRTRRRRPGKRARSWRLARRAAAVGVAVTVGLLAVGYRATTWQDGRALYLRGHRVELIAAAKTAADQQADLDTILTTTHLDDPESIQAGLEATEELLKGVADWDPPAEFVAYQATQAATVDALVAWLDNLNSQITAGATNPADDSGLGAALAQRRTIAQDTLERILQAHDLTDVYNDTLEH